MPTVAPEDDAELQKFNKLQQQVKTKTNKDQVDAETELKKQQQKVQNLK